MPDTFPFDPAHTCCFSGSRPEKLGFDWTSDTIALSALRRDLHHAIVHAIEMEYTRFITGMSRGFDLWAGEQVLRLQAVYPQIELICAIPFEDMQRTWSAYWRTLFHTVDQNCSFRSFMCRSYEHGCYHARDRYMVEQSSRVICWYNGTTGGTDYTCRYAQKLGRRLDNLYAAK